MDTKEEYLKKLEEQFREWKFKIDKLEDKASTLTLEAKAELLREITILRSKKAVVKEKWEDLLKSGSEAWSTTREGVEKAAGELKRTLDTVLSRFKD